MRSDRRAKTSKPMPQYINPVSTPESTGFCLNRRGIDGFEVGSSAGKADRVEVDSRNVVDNPDTSAVRSLPPDARLR